MLAVILSHLTCQLHRKNAVNVLAFACRALVVPPGHQGSTTAESRFNNINLFADVFCVSRPIVCHAEPFTDSLRTLNLIQSASIAQDEYNICMFVSSQLAGGQSSGVGSSGGRSAQTTDSSAISTQKTVTQPTEPQATSTQSISTQSTSTQRTGTQSTSTNACVWLVSGSTGSFRAPTTTPVSASVTCSTGALIGLITPITATYYADVVPYLVDVSSITIITTADASSSSSTMTVGPSGLCKSSFCVFSSHLHPTKPCCPSSLAPPWLSNSVHWPSTEPSVNLVSSTFGFSFWGTLLDHHFSIGLSKHRVLYRRFHCIFRVYILVRLFFHSHFHPIA